MRAIMPPDEGWYSYAGMGYANVHAPTTINGIVYRYDNLGNLASTSAGLMNAWDFRNRLISSGNGTATSTYAYDTDDKRVKKVEGGITTYYPNDLYMIAGATTTRFIYANGELIATIEANGTTTTTYYIHPDHLGSTNVVTNASGAVVQVLDYYPYGGARINNSTGGVDEKKKFAGMYRDDTGLDYAMARYYDNARGQFLSEDPVFWEIGQTPDGKAILSDPQSQNSYSWARDNPIINKDPNGRFWWVGFYDWSGYEGWKGVGMKNS